jgi:hypothetical protein
MADPSSFDIFGALGDWAFKALTGILAVFGWDAMTRLKELEKTKQGAVEALNQRTELKADIQALSARMDAQHNMLRDHIDNQSQGLRERLDAIVDRMGGGAR